MRNFFLRVTPGIDPRLGKYTFQEILKEVYHFMRVEINEKYINQQIRKNVSSELNPVIRATPLFLKKIILSAAYNFIGGNQSSGLLSNIGSISMPEEFENNIHDFQFIARPSPFVKTGGAFLSFKNRLYINFARMIENPTVEKLFFQRLVKLGLHVKVESNSI
jgi:NRPS condensation-like uncharacterized protein